MSKRFGRNQKRKLQQRLAEVEQQSALWVANARRLQHEAEADVRRVKSTSIFFPVDININYPRATLDIHVGAMYQQNRVDIVEPIDMTSIKLLRPEKEAEFMLRVGHGIAEQLWKHVRDWKGHRW